MELNSDLVVKTMNFHGQHLQKVWETERGEQDLAKQNATDLSFLIYGQRQKFLSFQDRSKRLKLQQFIVKKANSLFPKDMHSKPLPTDESGLTEDMFAIMPPFEKFLNVDKQPRMKKYFFEVVIDLIV